MRCIGKGYSAMTTLFGILGLPRPMSKSTYYEHSSVMCSSIEAVVQQSMLKAAEQATLSNPDTDHPDQVAVTIDGTWMKRGFSSRYGMVLAISWETGQVLDFCVLSKHCSGCQRWRSDRRSGKVSQAEFEAWSADHVCDVNTAASSPAMETEGVVTLFNRSVATRKLMYTTYIGDGDSKGFQAVVNAKPYGDVEITKEECVGHVSKRLGKALRELKKKKTPLIDGKPLSGRGRLTDDLCDSLQTYYNLAIRNGAQLPGDPITNMARLVWASICHRASTDAKPMHQFCPTDDDSFCKWQQWKAGKAPPYVHRNPIPSAVFEAVKPIIYQRL
eukprot:scpid61312/ scgid12962/ 